MYGAAVKPLFLAPKGEKIILNLEMEMTTCNFCGLLAVVYKTSSSFTIEDGCHCYHLSFAAMSVFFLSYYDNLL